MSSSMMSDEDDALRRAFAQDPSRSAEDPVDADALWDAVRGEAGPDAIAAMADRMAEDPAMAEDWRLAMTFAAEAEVDEALERGGQEGTPSPTHVVAAEPAANHGDYLRWGAVVAMVAAAVLLVLAWPRDAVKPYEPGNGQMRGGAAAITAVQGAGPLVRDAAVLEWSEVPGAVRYELRVSTTELHPVFESLDLTTTQVTLPAEHLVEQSAGARLVWKVEAVMADERRITSETFAATVQ